MSKDDYLKPMDIDYSDGGGHWIQWRSYYADYKPLSNWKYFWLTLRLRFCLRRMKIFRLFKRGLK